MSLAFSKGKTSLLFEFYAGTTGNLYGRLEMRGSTHLSDGIESWEQFLLSCLDEIDGIEERKESGQLREGDYRS